LAERQGDGGFRFSSKLERRLLRRTGAAIGDYQLIREDDHLLVAVSGGKDSLSLLSLLLVLARRSPVRFRMTVATVHPGYPSFQTAALEGHFRELGVEYAIEPVPIREILAEKLPPRTQPCWLCSRIRRGALYTIALRLGCNVVALGHHLDDFIETLLMNIFFGGQLRSMAPIYRSDDGRSRVIRPLCYVPEAWLTEYAAERRLPISSCANPACGGGDATRRRMKRLVSELAREAPGLRWQALRALRNVDPRHLLDLDLLPLERRS
jgi:tRNA 2-thiocytidine biosynthesis protein TtcA